MKLKTEITNDGEEEIIIRCRAVNSDTERLQRAIANIISSSAEMMLTLGDTEYFVPYRKILFFETDGGRTTAHTADSMMYTDLKLFELEAVLPYSFMRVSKSCIINTAVICSIAKNLSGASEASFTGTTKKAYISRMYYKDLIRKINETRLSK